jgi:ribosome-binding ATPase
MKIGLVGYQGSGKTSLWEWLTSMATDPAQAHVGQSAMATVPEPRVQSLCDIYRPKKITLAALELVDTPGLSRTHEGNPARLGLIREAGCLVLVVAAFGGSDPLTDLATFREDLLLADLEIVTGRVERLRESVKKPRPNRDQELVELVALEKVLVSLEAGEPLTADKMGDDELKATRSFRLMWEKPMLVVVNAADDDENLERFDRTAADGQPRMIAARVGLERELARMSDADRAEFEQEMGPGGAHRDDLLRAILDASGQMLYFTAGEKEVRTWMLRQGGTALEAADNVHSDLARGFIRAEVMQVDDLVRLGGEREVKAANLVRQEPKNYVIRDGDILHIRSGI